MKKIKMKTHKCENCDSVILNEYKLKECQVCGKPYVILIGKIKVGKKIKELITKIIKK